MPRLGGVAVFLTFFSIFLSYLVTPRFALASGRFNANVLKLLLPASWLFVTGLIDDVRGLSAKAKLFAQIAGGICLYLGGLRLLEVPLDHFGPWLGTTVSLIATVVLGSLDLKCDQSNRRS